jgi:hypothetical protein
MKRDVTWTIPVAPPVVDGEAAARGGIEKSP